jgi:hypothetical protein
LCLVVEHDAPGVAEGGIRATSGGGPEVVCELGEKVCTFGAGEDVVEDGGVMRRVARHVWDRGELYLGGDDLVWREGWIWEDHSGSRRSWRCGWRHFGDIVGSLFCYSRLTTRWS